MKLHHGILSALLLAALLPVGSGPAGQAAAEEQPDSSRQRRFYLEGLDLALPAQEAFRDWPPERLTDRRYWSPWGYVTFRRAALFGRPVLLILTVDWSRDSRRMVDEVLSEPEMLRRVNRDFITIHVNADRRPDIKERYQTGTWPVIAVLTPDGNPMLTQAHDLQVAGPITTGPVTAEVMRFVIDEAAKYWNKSAQLLINQGKAWARNEGPAPPVPGAADEEAADLAAGWLIGSADQVHGGFGAGPRFVVPGLLEFALLRRSRDMDDLSAHARQTLQRMVASGLYDAEAGGIRRMALLPDWSGIQPEKMLVGNAEFLRELTHALRAADSESLRAALASTAHFIATRLHRDEGGLCLAAFPAHAGGVARDCLVLSGPNSIAGAALLRAGSLLGDARLVSAGRRALDFVVANGFRPGRGVSHIIAPRPDERIFLAAQAETALGLLDGYETTGKPIYRDAAREIVDFARMNLWRPRESSLRDHLEDARPVGLLANPRRPLRPNVRLARAMLRLSLHGLGDDYADEARRILSTHSGDLGLFGVHGTEAGLAVEELIQEPLRVRIDGDGPDATAMRAAASASPWPWTVILTGETGQGATVSAELEWYGRTVTVRDPNRLHSAIRQFTGGATE